MCEDLKGMDRQTCRLTYIKAKVSNNIGRTFDVRFKKMVSEGMEPDDAMKELVGK